MTFEVKPQLQSRVGYPTPTNTRERNDASIRRSRCADAAIMVRPFTICCCIFAGIPSLAKVNITHSTYGIAYV